MKKIFGALVALFLVGIVTAGAVSAFGFGGKRGYNEDVHEAIENEDYGAWKEAITEELTEERFQLQLERHQMHKERLEELGIDYDEFHEAQEAKRAAIESGDYDAYMDAVNGLDLPKGSLTEDEFNTLVEMHEAKSGEGGFGRGQMSRKGLGMMG
jgi:hypothetical protein